jgi:20S proteasome subunit beta 1
MAVTYGEGEHSGVIIGADSRTSTGSYVANRVSDKLTPVHDSIYCCRSGSTADTQAVADYVRHALAQHATMLGTSHPPVKTAAHLFKRIVYSNKDALSASIICAGWDPVSVDLCGSFCVRVCVRARVCVCDCV